MSRPLQARNAVERPNSKEHGAEVSLGLVVAIHDGVNESVLFSTINNTDARVRIVRAQALSNQEQAGFVVLLNNQSLPQPIPHPEFVLRFTSFRALYLPSNNPWDEIK